MNISSHSILRRRLVDPAHALALQQAMPGLSTLESRLLSSRGAVERPPTLAELITTGLKDLDCGAARIRAAIKEREKLVVVADYDCDGATACAVMVSGLRALGADIEYVVPDRMVHGYGISPSVVDLAMDKYPDACVLITVDNGILGHAGILYASRLGLDVVVTDHHLPGDSLPSACAVIDPSRTDCSSGLAKLAGVGVALWVVLEVKRQLARDGIEAPSMNFLLPYVAIGTVADMVPLDEANRQLITIGLNYIRRGLAPVGINALIQEAGLAPAYLTTQDIGFGLGPRINAAGRLQTMDAGIDLLLAQDAGKAKKLAKLLTQTNLERKQLQKDATQEADLAVEISVEDSRSAIVSASEDWHPGVIGLVASRLKDTYFRPTFIFSLQDGKVKGSGRSIPGFHLKDALEEVARRAPGVLTQFGGHAMAAGATLSGIEALETFKQVFEAVALDRITSEMRQSTLYSDGAVPDLTTQDAASLLRHPWGQGFEAPAFDSEASITAAQALGAGGLHWKIRVRLDGSDDFVTVILFNQPEPIVGSTVHLYLQPSLNTWNGSTSLQWLGKII